MKYLFLLLISINSYAGWYCKPGIFDSPDWKTPRGKCLKKCMIQICGDSEPSYDPDKCRNSCYTRYKK